MIKLNENSYITLNECEEYIKDNYLPTDTIRVHWEVLPIEEKEIYLRKAVKNIDSLSLKGHKLDFNQKLQFPRSFNTYTMIYGYNVPMEVKQAQCEEVYGLIKKEYTTLENKQFKVLQSLGAVKNFKFNKRQSAEVNTIENFGEPKKDKQDLASEDAYKLLQFWIWG